MTKRKTPSRSTRDNAIKNNAADQTKSRLTPDTEPSIIKSSEINPVANQTNQKEIPMTKEFTIKGHKFVIEVPYAEGHVLTANEAATLNQTFVENIRNNQAKVVETGLAEGKTVEDLQAVIADFASKYTFGAGRSTTNSTPRDPVAAAAVRIARSVLTAALKEKKVDVKTFDKDKFEALVAQIASKPEVIEKAREQVAQKAEVNKFAADLDI
jgi:cbb3-type cytochrome oxidase cytochrome c subunit